MKNEVLLKIAFFSFQRFDTVYWEVFWKELQLALMRPSKGERACIIGSEYIFLENLNWRP